MKKQIIMIMAIFLFFAGELLSQTDEEIFQEFKFNFSPPGARAAAMGKAFIGLADDTTAAETNPAGLTTLVSPELSFEYKATDTVIKRFASENSLIDKIPTDFGGKTNFPSFISFFYPFKNIHISLFRHEYLNLKDEFNFERRIVKDFYYFPLSSTMNFKGANYGVAIAAKSGNLSIGLSFKLSTLKAEAETFREYFFYSWTPYGYAKGNKTIIDDTDKDYSFAAGLLYKFNEKISLGAVYSRSPKFKIKEDFGFVLTNDRFVSFGYNSETQRFPTEIFINVPDKFGVGISYHPNESFTFLTDIVRIQYSQLVDNFKIIFEGKDYIKPEDYEIKNATEIHMGAEYVSFIYNYPIALRGGLFTSPDNKIRFINPNIPIAEAQEQSFLEDLYWNSGERITEIGFTLGGGIVLQNRFQLDAAFSHSKSINEFTLSTVVKF